ITGNVSVPLLGKDSFQEVDIAGITMPIVKHNWIVKDVNSLAEIVREAFIVAGTGRPGPVLIDIPKDITSQNAEWIPLEGKGRKNFLLGASKTADLILGEAADSPAAAPASLKIEAAAVSARAGRLEERAERLTFTAGDIDRAVLMLGEARRPVIYAGGGVIISGAGSELVQLAERLNAPAALSLMGIGAFPASHPLCTGLIGMHGTVASNKAVQKADLLIAVGARFSDRVTSQVDKFANSAKVLHFDIDPAEINKNVPSDAWVIGDIKATLGQVLKKLPPKVATDWNGEVEQWKTRVPKDHHRKTALHPRFVIEETARRLGDDAIVVTDVGQHQMWTAQFYPLSRPRSFITSGGLGTMGFGLGAAIGAKTANPERPVVLFTGDGCFRMNCGELATIGAYRIPILIVIINNRVLGMVRQWQTLFYEARYAETTLDRPPDFVKLAAAYGVGSAACAETEAAFISALEAALGELAAGRPALIEARVDSDEKVLPMVPGGKPIDEQIL
ncbi:MAG: acetolactate synthase large subunit, partial [Treponema sp.]|nr:acetolactate synthase large subunit [Treponema sp.]